MTTKRAPVGLKEPVERFLQGVSDADTSKLDGSAVRATRLGHDPTRLLSPYWVRRGWPGFWLTASSNVPEVHRAGRLPRGPPPALPLIPPVSSGRALVASPLPSRAKPDVCVVLVISYPFDSFTRTLPKRHRPSLKPWYSSVEALKPKLRSFARDTGRPAVDGPRRTRGARPRFQNACSALKRNRLKPLIPLDFA